MSFRALCTRFLALGCLIASAAACGDDEPAPCQELEGECVGVPPAGVCDDELCTEGVSCSVIVEVSDATALAEAAASAAPGSCIALAPGSYADVALAGGVSLLGAGADRVSVGAIDMASGPEAVVRGLHAQGTVRLAEGAVVKLDAVRATGTPDAIVVAKDASLALLHAEVRGATDYAIAATDAARVVLDHTIVEDNGGPGLWATCSMGCSCTSRPEVTLSWVLARRNAYVSVGLVGVTATLDRVHILDSVERNFDFGAGLSASGCSELTVSDLHVEHATSFGVLLDGVGVSAKGIIIIGGGKGGLWIENVAGTQEVEIHDLVLEQNAGVGLGIGGELEALGIIIIGGGKVANTASTNMPVVDAQGIPLDSEAVGDGILWTNGALAQLSGLSVSSSARHAFLINGPVASGSSLAEITLEAGEIVQQGADVSGMPEIGAGVPAFEPTAQNIANVPVAPQPPPLLAK